MADVKWIKITTDIFDDDKILLIESLPEADSIIVIWFKLLCFAGKQNNSGVFMMNDRIAYTDKMLATIFRRKESTVQLALKTFEEFGMITIVDGAITIPNWGKHQNLDRLEERKEYMREYMKGYREKQKLLASGSEAEGKANCKVYGKANVSALDKEEEKEVEREEEREEDKRTVSCVGNQLATTRQPKEESPIQVLVEAWNNSGFRRIERMSPSSTRYKMANRRIEEYGIDKVLEALYRADKSDFLHGKSDRGWEMDFDWFVKPSNFQKVLEGNYDNRGKKNKTFLDMYKELKDEEDGSCATIVSY